MDAEFLAVARAHRARYPAMEPQDFAKLAYQREFGPGHLIAGADARSVLSEEWTAVGATPPAPPTDIGGGLCRFPLSGPLDPADTIPLLAALFVRTAQERRGTQAGLRERLEALRALDAEGMDDFLARWEARGFPALHHSEAYRAAYDPHYRVIGTRYAVFFPALLAVGRALRPGRPVVVSLDGRCGSGKTTLAALLAELFGGRVLHLDDYYLPPAARRPDWERIPAGNMDLARFRAEALEPARRGETIRVRPFDCRTGRRAGTKTLLPALLTVAEGSYSQHPLLAKGYDLSFFLTCSPEEQARRLRAREGAGYGAFESRWIPLEEQYFRLCSLPAPETLVLHTDFFKD